MSWTQPVYDRTLADVQQQTTKGFCNAGDLNRVEENCAVLAQLLGVAIATKVWQRTDFPTVSEIGRISSNIAALRAAYYTRQSTPATPENPLNTWQKWNAAEAILHDLHSIYTANQEVVQHSGELILGETIGVM